VAVTVFESSRDDPRATAGGTGTLEVVDGCLKVRFVNGSPSETVAVFASWADPTFENNALVYDGKSYPVGSTASFGGGFSAPGERVTLPSSCGDPSEIMFVSDVSAN
jgi:hypothetical protein